MKLLLDSGDTRELPIGAALCALPVTEVRLGQQDIGELIQKLEHKPEHVIEYLKTLYIRFPPEPKQ